MTARGTTRLRPEDVPAFVHVRVIVGMESSPLNALDDEAERAWLPIIGPTAMLLARRLITEGDDIYNVAELAAQFGVNALRMWAAFQRLDRRKLILIERVDWSSAPEVTVRTRWPNPPTVTR